MNRTFEKLSPYLYSVICTALIWKFCSSDCRIKVSDALGNPVVSVMAIAAGFIGVSLSIVITASTKSLQRFKATSHYRDFIDFHHFGIYASVLSCLTSIAVLGNASLQKDRLPYVDIVWIFSTILASLAFIRVLKVFKALFSEDDSASSSLQPNPHNSQKVTDKK